jgi:hypothetical protein
MKQSISVSQFDDAFRDYGREDNFSYAGRHALYEWLEELGDDTGQEFELDIIALCCEFSEYEDLAEFQANYGDEYESLDDISEQTTVIPVGVDSFIIQDF